MPQRHNALGGIWEDVQMVFPSPLSAITNIKEKQPIQVLSPMLLFLCVVVAPLFETMQVMFAKLQCEDLVMS
jgi:hypothetical protein